MVKLFLNWKIKKILFLLNIYLPAQSKILVLGLVIIQNSIRYNYFVFNIFSYRISPRITRARAIERKRTTKRKQFDWATVLAGHPERDIKKDKPKEVTSARFVLIR